MKPHLGIVAGRRINSYLQLVDLVGSVKYIGAQDFFNRLKKRKRVEQMNGSQIYMPIKKWIKRV
jgi:hypothetical protein